jgi:hypothetical protein
MFSSTYLFAFSDSQKKAFREAHQQEYVDGTMQHNVSLEEIKKIKSKKFSHNKSTQLCIQSATTSKEIGSCIKSQNSK